MYKTATATTDLCLEAAAATGKKICSTFSSYVSYSDASLASTTEKSYLYNQWH